MDQFYPVSIQIEAWDRVGLLRDISAAVAEEKVNIGNVNSRAHEDGTTSVRLILDARSMAELSRLLSRIEAVRGVISAARVLEGVK
jgi:GTP pyrophosphokinase